MSNCVISCRNHGPYRVAGDFVLQDAAGDSFELSGKEVIWLCRCGHTKDIPFCDGSHKRVGFVSEAKARSPASPE